MNSFLRTLWTEGKLKLTSPSKEICSSYLDKSHNSLVSAKTLLEIGNYDDAVALTYYSMYHSALALLYLCGIKSENHSGTIILLKEIFGLDNKAILLAKKERIDKQYYIDFKATAKDVDDGIVSAEDFSSIIKSKIDAFSEHEIEKIFLKAKTIFSGL